jgi:Type I phosphodiesterase / nucleotide pyrophosphatase
MTTARRLCQIFVFGYACVMAAKGDEPTLRTATRNVILVTADGLRWQEVFRGAELALFNKPDGGVEGVPTLRREFWRDDTSRRREALLPFLWTTVARQGQIFGNRDKLSPARVTNGLNFSYPGYNEIFTGWADPKIDSNDKFQNPNVSVLEWLNRKPAYKGRVSAVASWDLYPYILNVNRSGLLMNAGWVPFEGPSLTAEQLVLNRLIMQSPRLWEDCRNDAFTFQVALEHIRRDAPRVLYIGYGDTDEHAHGGRYDNYLRATRDFDENLKILWQELQSHPQYRGSTTLILTTDHGRGDAPRGWRDHGKEVAGSEAIWIAVLGPDTPALGERTNVEQVTQSQVAATLAAVLGEDYGADAPKAARAIGDVIRTSGKPAASTSPGR